MARALIALAGMLACLPVLAEEPVPAPLSVDTLRTPERAAEWVSTNQLDAYHRVMAAYAREQAAHPDDAALALARCQFAERFADNDDDDAASVSWSEDAGADQSNCQKALEGRFGDDPEVALYIAERHYGKDAIPYAHALVRRSDHWTAQQRSRLHAVLAHGYAATKQASLSGQEALAAVQLDPHSNELISALRYLCDQGRTTDAQTLMAATPYAANAWAGTQRVRFALDNFSAAAALAELQRAQAAGKTIDAWTSARIYQRAGFNAKATEMLAKVKTKPEFQTPEQFQLRVDVASAHGDGLAAATAVHDWFAKAGFTVSLLGAYATTLAHAPGQIFSVDLMPVMLATLGVLTGLILLPGVLAFPAHYRGTVRARVGKSTPPLFASVGLRHLWIGLAAFLVADTLVPMLGAGSALHATTALRPMSSAEEHVVVFAQIALLVVGFLCLVPMVRRFSRNDWLGDRSLAVAVGVVLGWACIKGLLLWAASYAPQPVTLAHYTLHDRAVMALTQAARHVSGAWLALLLTAVLVPIYEEIVFRGLVLGGLTRHISFGWANLLQAALFAALHVDFAHFQFYFLLGLAAGWLVRRTGGLAASMALHAVNNAIACALILSWAS